MHIIHTAVEGVDFDPNDLEFEIVFEALIIGSTATRCALINFIDDNILESSEFFTVTVSSVTPSIVIGDTSRNVEVQINDTDGKNWSNMKCLTFSILAAVICELSFVSLSYTVSEDVGSVDVCVRTTGLPSGGLAADLEVGLVFMDSTKTSKFCKRYTCSLLHALFQVSMMTMILQAHLLCLKLDSRVMAAFSVSISL